VHDAHPDEVTLVTGIVVDRFTVEVVTGAVGQVVVVVGLTEDVVTGMPGQPTVELAASEKGSDVVVAGTAKVCAAEVYRVEGTKASSATSPSPLLAQQHAAQE